MILREISDDDMDFDWLNPKMYTLYISIPLGGGGKIPCTKRHNPYLYQFVGLENNFNLATFKKVSTVYLVVWILIYLII